MNDFEEIVFLRHSRADMLVKWETVTVYITFAKVQDKKKFWFREAEVGTMKEILWNWLGRKIGKILGRVDGGERI